MNTEKEIEAMLMLVASQQKMSRTCDELTDIVEHYTRVGTSEEYWDVPDVATIMAEQHYLETGTVLHEYIEVEYVLGEGGFGITYKGMDLNLDIPVAVKEYYPKGYAVRSIELKNTVSVSTEKDLALFNTGKEKFLHEARAIAKFANLPGIVGVKNFFKENNTAYIVMEYLDGITLKDYLKEALPFSADEIFMGIKPIMESLRVMHANNFIHRDISPDNIMMLKDGSFKLMDFGAGRIVDFDNPDNVTIVLKTGYAPEEQYRPRGHQGPWTDIYALCATMYKCITGDRPEDALQRMYDDDMKWPSELGFDITPVQEAVLKKGMAVDYHDRFASIDEIEGFMKIDQTTAAGRIAEEDIQEDIEGEQIRVNRKARMRKKASISSIVALIVLIATFIIAPGQTVKLSEDDIVLPVKGTKSVILKNSEGDIVWIVTDPEVAKIEEMKNGVVVEGLKKGKTEIIADLEGDKYTCLVSVENPKFNKKNITVQVGEKSAIRLKDTTQRVEWKISKNTVAKINKKTEDSAWITGVKKGKAKLTATVGNVSFTCSVTVIGKKFESAGEKQNAGTSNIGKSNMKHKKTKNPPSLDDLPISVDEDTEEQEDPADYGNAEADGEESNTTQTNIEEEPSVE